MNISFPLLLLVLGGLTFWLLSESKLRWYFKVACISLFCFFTVVFWLTTHSYLGRPAQESDVPEMVNIHWIVVKEPNKLSGFSGKFYLLMEASRERKVNVFLRFFGFKTAMIEPRLYEMSYSRKLHEQINGQILPRLKSGQIVRGKFSKERGEGGGSGKGSGKEKAGKGKGWGSESQEQEWVFHDLRPSQIHQKDPAETNRFVSPFS